MPRILVVDDNPELLTLLSSAFEEAGYEVQTAARGRSALDSARKDRPDLVVLDVLLPDLMGFDVADALKRLRIPFVFMSGVHKGGKAASGAAAKYGALAYFEKPFDRNALLAAVAQVVPPPANRPPQGFDVEDSPQVSEAAEAMSLTGRVELHGQKLRGGTVELRPLASGEIGSVPATQRLDPALLRPVSAKAVTTGPIRPGDEGSESSLQARPANQPGGGVRRGELTDNLPQLLAAFYSTRETGELGLQKGQVKKVIYFEQGLPVFALSNLVADRFGHFLVRAGKIDEETLKHAAEEASSSRQRTGDVLILMGALTEEERLYYVAQQIKSILYSVFAWESGSYYLTFQQRARKEAIKLDIHPANLVMRGVKKLYKPERLSRILAEGAKPIPSPDPLFNLSDLELQAWEAHLLTKCDGNRTVAQLVAFGGRADPNETLASLVGLASLRILELR